MPLNDFLLIHKELLLVYVFLEGFMGKKFMTVLKKNVFEHVEERPCLLVFCL